MVHELPRRDGVGSGLTATPGVLLLDERGRLRCATPVAKQLLQLVAAGEDVAAELRALHARQSLAGPDAPAVTAIPLPRGGRLVLTAARAEPHVAVVVEADHTDPIESIAGGSLTPRELEVVELVVQGLSTKRIAAHLAIRCCTVQQHLKSIFAKSGVNTRGELSALVRHRATRSAA